MSETPPDIPHLLRETGALLEGHFRLSSGLHSPQYVQCARLLEHPKNSTAIGDALADCFVSLGAQRVVAPALGGLIIGFAVADALSIPMIFTERKDGAMQLRRGFAIGDRKKVIIIEDVVTTGKSTRETAAVVEQSGGEVLAYGSILNRSGSDNPFDKPFHSLLRMDLESHPEKSCPLCAAGVPLDSPGSRFAGAT